MGAWVSYLKGTPGPSGFGSASTAEDVTAGLDLHNYTAIVTGGTAGIGLETARVLAKRGARVVLAIRNIKVGEQVKADFLKETPDARVEVMKLDLSNLNSVRTFAADFKESKLPLNILVNNGGITANNGPLATPDGLELMFATNFLGHFVLTNLLLDTMKATAKETGIQGRIVVVSGAIYNFTPKGGIDFDKLINSKKIYGFSGYGQSKLANILHCRELSRRLQEEGANITVNTLHPGAIRTKLVKLDGFLGFITGLPPNCLFKTPEQGAATQVFLAANPKVEGKTGSYYIDCNEYPLEGKALDIKLQAALWKWAEDYVSTH
jgi:WW domain-containing oxidoreductase